jgi:hypothetical protein
LVLSCLENFGFGTKLNFLQVITWPKLQGNLQIKPKTKLSETAVQTKPDGVLCKIQFFVKIIKNAYNEVKKKNKSSKTLSNRGYHQKFPISR